MKIGEAIRKGVQRMVVHQRNTQNKINIGVEDIDTLKHETKILLAHVMKSKYEDINKNDNITNEQFEAYKSLLNRRMTNEPLQYITENTYFCRREFEQRPNVLIARDDTEPMIQLYLDSVGGKASTNSCYDPYFKMFQLEKREHKETIDELPETILDIGVGSGIILVTAMIETQLLATTHKIKGYGIDKSKEAIALAKKNAEKHNVNVLIEEADLFEWKQCNQQYTQETYDIIFSNPPYIPTAIVETLETQVKEYEPHLALDGGVTGMDYYAAILEMGQHPILKPGGKLIIEINDNVKAIEEILPTCYKIEAIARDWQEQERAMLIRKNV